MENLKKIIITLFHPKLRSVNVCTRKDVQPVAKYLAKSRKLSEFCNYGNKLDE